jgi:hypothetical protein
MNLVFPARSAASSLAATDCVGRIANANAEGECQQWREPIYPAPGIARSRHHVFKACLKSRAALSLARL